MLFEAKSLKEALGVSQQKLSQWHQRGLITSTRAPIGGTGSRNLYSLENACQIKIFNDLRETCKLRASEASQIAFSENLKPLIRRITEGNHPRSFLAPSDTYLAIVRNSEDWKGYIVSSIDVDMIVKKSPDTVIMLNLEPLMLSITFLIKSM
jgi:hypothetical protein